MNRLVLPLLILSCTPENRAFRNPIGALRIETTQIDFGDGPLDSLQTVWLPVTNHGNAVLRLVLDLEGPAEAFQIMRSSLDLDALETAQLEIRYRPQWLITPSRATLHLSWENETQSAVIELVGATLLDADGDGEVDTRLGGLDCDDTDDSIYPGAPEVWYDGIDGNCDGESDYDQDLDGFDRIPEGKDCDDSEPGRFPGQSDGTQADPLLGEDSDCDLLVDEDAFAFGDFLITEAMILPSDQAAAFIEFQNTSDRTLVLDGWKLELNGHAMGWPKGIEVAPGDYVLACDDIAEATHWDCDLEWPGSIGLGAGSGIVKIGPPALAMDQIQWDSTWPIVSGASIQLDAIQADPLLNDSPSAWCESDQPMTGGGLGTPGFENSACPQVSD
jgi:hypothetical protein